VSMEKYVTVKKKAKTTEDVASSVVYAVATVPGLVVEQRFLSPEEEELLIERIDASEWKTSLKRRVQHYGFEYAYGWGGLTPTTPIPKWAQPVLDKLATRGFTGFDQMIVNEYLPGECVCARFFCV
jgi:alkylated DNA repair dioxygenase AlkB